MKQKRWRMVKATLKFFAILPLPINHIFGAMIGIFLSITPNTTKKIVSTNINTCFPDLGPYKKKKLIRKTLIETGKSFTESGFIWFNNFSNNSKCISEIIGLEHIDSDQPAILLVPHFGCWEITGRVLSLTRPVTFLYKPLKNKRFEELLFSLRQQGDLSMASADKKGVAQVQRALNNKQLVGILPDQNPGGEGGVFAPFFSQKVRTMTLLVKLARKSDTKVLMTWAERLKHGKGYKLNLKPINVLSDTGKIEDDVATMNKEIESLIRTIPEQYLFNYNRFKSAIK